MLGDNMISRVEQIRKERLLRRFGNPEASYALAAWQMNPSIHQYVNDPNKVGEVKESGSAKMQSVESEMVGKTHERRDVVSYFSKATGLKKKEQVSRLSKPTREEKSRFFIDTRDRIQMSKEAVDEIKMDRGEFDIIRERNPLNLKAFCDNLGLKVPEGIEKQDQIPLAQKLEMISMRTAGKKWNKIK